MEEHFKNKLKNHKVDWDKEELLVNLKQELSGDQSRFNRKWFLLLPILFLATCWGVSKMEVSNAESMAHLDGAQKEISDSETGHEKAETLDANREEIKTKGDLSNQSEINIAEELASSSLVEKETESVGSASFGNKINKISTFNFRNLDTPDSNIGIAQNRNSELNVIEQSGVVKNEYSKKEAMELLSVLAFVGSPLECEFDFSLPESRISTDEIIPAEKEDDFKNSFFVSGSAEIGVVDRVITSLSDRPEFYEPLLAKEKTINTSTFQIGYQHQSGFSLASGLEHSQIREFLKFDIPLVNDTLTTPLEGGDYFFDQDMNIYFVDSMTVVERQTRKIRHKNIHTFLNVPIQIGYRKSMRKIDVYGTVGASYTFRHNYKGREIQIIESGGFSVIDNVKFKLKNRIGLQAGIGVEYPILKKTSSFLTMNYRRSPTLQFYEKDEMFYHSFSLGAGVRYSF